MAAGDVTLTGTDGADTLAGGDGNDLLTGGYGSDNLDGGAGDDSLTGGPDADAAPDYAPVEGVAQVLTGSHGNGDFSHSVASSGGAVDSTTVAIDGGQEMVGYRLGSAEDATTSHLHSFSQEVAGAKLSFVGIDPGEQVVIWIDGVALNLNLALEAGIVRFDPGTSGVMLDGTGALVSDGSAMAEPAPAVLVITLPFTTLVVETLSPGGAGDGTVYALAVDTNPPALYDDGDTVDGGAGNDVIAGGGGNDSLTGGPGDDLVYGGAGDDTLSAGGTGPANDTLYGGTGNDRITVASDAGFIIVDAGEEPGDRDQLVLTDLGSGGVQVNFSGDGAGGFGFVDGTSGGTFTGIEVLETSDSSDNVNAGASGGGEVIRTLGGNDYVAGGAGADLIDAGTGEDEVFAGGGNDTVFGNDGRDNLYGGTGNDTLYGGSGNDYMQGDAGNDTLYAGEGDDFLRGDAGNDAVYGGVGNDSVYGGADNDSVFGGEGNDQVYGGLSDDTLFGGSGNDMLHGVAGNDLLYAEDGDDEMHGSVGSDTLYGGAGNDTMLGEEDADTFYGGAGDYVEGGEAVSTGVDDDRLFLSDVDRIDWDPLNPENGTAYFLDGGVMHFYGIEKLYVDGAPVHAPDGIVSGTEGGDLIDAAYAGDPDGDLVDGGDASLPGAAPDDDVILAGAGNDTVLAGAGDDLVQGGSGDDFLAGGAGDDTLKGGAGADTLAGGAGSDLIDLGAGDGAQDLVVLADAAGSDVVSGFEAPIAHADGSFTGQDLLDVSELTDAGGKPVTTDDVTVTDTNGDGTGDAILTFPGGEQITLLGIGPAEISLPGALVAMGIPPGAPQPPDFIVEGTVRDDLIDTAYLGDPEGDRVDHADNAVGDEADKIEAGAGNDTVLAGLGADTVHGGAGADILDGGAGADLLFGGDDADRLHGGMGDTIDGGEGGIDQDTLDLDGFTRQTARVLFDDDNPENGMVEFLGGSGDVIGTLRFQNIEHVVLPCFTPGAQIATALGDVRVEDLREGDRVITRDRGYQKIRWIGRRSLTAADLAEAPQFRPIRIARGALGLNLPDRDLVVSPQHRMLLSSSRAELLFGDHEVLIAATHLLGRHGVTREAPEGVTYIHLLFDHHEIIRANGAWTESYQPGELTLSGMDDDQRDELLSLFPQLKVNPSVPAARTSLKRREVEALFMA